MKDNVSKFETEAKLSFQQFAVQKWMTMIKIEQKRKIVEICNESPLYPK